MPKPGPHTPKRWSRLRNVVWEGTVDAEALWLVGTLGILMSSRWSAFQPGRRCLFLEPVSDVEDCKCLLTASSQSFCMPSPEVKQHWSHLLVRVDASNSAHLFTL